ncbi:phage tail protein [Burkholderia plantarii]|uniref:phage tail protein n=1 Tax=Burkholderia plantarii TaxID=41899 RepID=UPI00272BDE9F|nr:phage tail protein [Burkholderia plantarii]WLE59275.1 phage tail protein [Burkholderia plantarii]
MIKPASLRAAIVAAIPALAKDPDKMTVFIDKGSIAATGTKSLSFEYRYMCNVLLMDFAGDADDLMIVILAWAREYQPDLVTNWDGRSSAITYEIDILNNTTADISITMPLSENVVVKYDAAGHRTVTHVDDRPDASLPWVSS